MSILRRELFNRGLAAVTACGLGGSSGAARTPSAGDSQDAEALAVNLGGGADLLPDSVANRRAAEAASWASDTTHIRTAGYVSAGDGGGALWRRTSRDPEHSAAFQSRDGKWWELAETNLTPQMFGARGDGSSRNDDALAAMQSFASLRTLAGNTVRIDWPSGRYVYGASPNWAINRLHMNFQGEVWLVNVGTGPSFILDGGAEGTGVYGVQITGYPQLYGGPATTHGLYARAIYRSKLEINCRGAGARGAGLYGEWLVSNDIHFIMNGNEGGLYSQPSFGIYLTRRNRSEESSYNCLWNLEASHLPVGIYLDGSLGNVFYGGASQGNEIGLSRTPNAWNDKFIGVDFEVNSTDVIDDGREGQFLGCDFQRGPIFKSKAVNATVLGGVTENLTVEAGAAGVLLTGVTYNRFGAGLISDEGSRTRYRDLRNKVSSAFHDRPRMREPLAAERSPFEYENRSGNTETIIVYGGQVLQITLTRFAGDPLGVAAGQFLLGPDDRIRIEYSVAPAIVRWT